MTQRLYNVRTRTKEDFQPRVPGKVGMYVCGLTVYDHAHLGHARTAVSFEVIRRQLESQYDLTFVQNVTDVEDKILARAAELGVSPKEHARTWDKKCLDAMTRLGVRAPDHMPRVTQNIGPIIGFIAKLIDKGYAYATDAGNVYFDVQAYDQYAAESFPDHRYGSLSNRKVEEMLEGARKDPASDKQHPADFALWKMAGDDIHADGAWQSPWGRGRPGWHIECSVMSTNLLGNSFDIHGGGQDLIFPHHENEIAQSQACTGEAPFANTWIHTGFLNVEGQKMSKSLGNFIVLQDLMDELEGEGTDLAALRLYFIQTHYRSKIDFSRKGLQESKDALARLERTRAKLAEQAQEDANLGDIEELVASFQRGFDEALLDDVHTPAALAEVFQFQRALNGLLDNQELKGTHAMKALRALEAAGERLTLFDRPPQLLEIPAEVQDLVQQREDARQAKDWGQADLLRDQILSLGFRVGDGPNGPEIERA